MRILTRSRFRKSVVGLVSLFAFLLFVGTAPFALAASDWPTWPPKKEAPALAETPKGTITEEPVKVGASTETGTAPAAPMVDTAANAGKAAGKNASAGITSGTLGWIALGIGSLVLLGVAFSGSSTPNH